MKIIPPTSLSENPVDPCTVVAVPVEEKLSKYGGLSRERVKTRTLQTVSDRTTVAGSPSKEELLLSDNTQSLSFTNTT